MITTTNEQLSAMGLATVEDTRRSMLPAAVAIKGRTGKVLGHRQAFTSTRSAKDIKAALKAQNPKMSGKALAARVNEVLTGETDLRMQLGVAWLQGAFQSGMAPDEGVMRKNTGNLKLVRIRPTVAPVAEVKPVSRDEALKVLGLSEADIEAMKALLGK